METQNNDDITELPNNNTTMLQNNNTELQNFDDIITNLPNIDNIINDIINDDNDIINDAEMKKIMKDEDINETTKSEIIKINDIKKTNYKYLCYTNLLLVLSVLYFLFNLKSINKNSIIEIIFAIALVLTIILSQLFWRNPIKSSRIHKIDAINAKIVILTFILYTIIFKFKLSFLFILVAIFISSYFSNRYSKQEWCSNKHILCHGLLHIFCFIATFYTFAPVY
jgi:hypothetical protein